MFVLCCCSVAPLDISQSIKVGNCGVVSSFISQNSDPPLLSSVCLLSHAAYASVSICAYHTGHKWSTTHRVLKSHKSKMSVIYMQSWKQCALPVITTMALWQLILGHMMYMYMMYIYIYVYDSQIVHNNPCFNLFILHNIPFDSQGSEINKNNIFLRFDILSFTKTFFLLHIQ